MFEMLFVMMAVAAQSAGGASGPSTDAGQGTAMIAMEQAQGDAAAEPQQDSAAAAPPSFLAPGPSDQPAAPSFLAPKDAAEPAFLAPSRKAPVAEPQVPTGRFTTAVEVKPILAATRNAWISVRDFNGQDLVYVTHLWSWRCGLVELRIGVNGNPPESWPLPECHMDQQMPAAILESDGLPYRAFPSGSVAMIEVELVYDDLTRENAKFNRMGIEIP